MQRPSEVELRAFVGPRAGYYLSAWAQGEQGGPWRASLAAFLGSALWLGYRKMYVPLALLLGALLVESLAADFIFLKALGHAQVPRELSLVTNVAMGTIVGVCGNRWYHRHVLRGIAAVPSVEPATRLALLARRGGGSWLIGIGSLLGLLLVFGVLHTLLSALLGIPQPRP